MKNVSLLDVLVALQERSIRLHSRLLPKHAEWERTYQTRPRNFSDDIPRDDGWELGALAGSYTLLGETLKELGLIWPNPLLVFLDNNVLSLDDLPRGDFHKASFGTVDELREAFHAGIG